MSGSGISWDICKSAPRSRQITTPVPHHSIFYRPDARPAAQPTASKHWRQVTDNSTLLNYTHTHVSCVIMYSLCATSSPPSFTLHLLKHTGLDFCQYMFMGKTKSASIILGSQHWCYRLTAVLWCRRQQQISIDISNWHLGCRKKAACGWCYWSTGPTDRQTPYCYRDAHC